MAGLSVDAERSEPSGERFEPDSMGKHLIEAEHLVRYAWAAQFAAGRRVLDAACGVGYGTAMLAAAGATEVVGVDRDKSVIAQVRAGAPTGATFDVGDLRTLSYDDDDFDLVVCFEAIEHVEDQEKVLDELRRVLRPEGLLVVSTPNRDVYLPGNPFHLRELTPSEFEAELLKRFRSVALRRQHTWIASAVLDDEAFRSGGHTLIEGAELHKAHGEEPGRETYTLALASDADLPAGHSSASLTADVDIRDWSERLEQASRVVDAVPREEVMRREAEIEMLRGELGQLREQLAAGEAEMARYVGIEARLTGVDAVMREHEALVSSLSWRITKPLRWAAARLRRPGR